MKNLRVLLLLVVLPFVIISCASGAKPVSDSSVEEKNVVQEEVIEEVFWTLEELEGTVWEYETVVHDFQAWRGFEIKDGSAFFYQKIGNAVDMHEGEKISLEGNRIKFLKENGDFNIGELEENQATVNGEIYYLVE